MTFLKLWLNHFALNIGAAILSICYAIVPPQFTHHNQRQLTVLQSENPLTWFLYGLLDNLVD
jgi:hypothetical protein